MAVMMTVMMVVGVSSHGMNQHHWLTILHAVKAHLVQTDIYIYMYLYVQFNPSLTSGILLDK